MWISMIFYQNVCHLKRGVINEKFLNKRKSDDKKITYNKVAVKNWVLEMFFQHFVKCKVFFMNTSDKSNNYGAISINFATSGAKLKTARI